ncbi:MAG TPA: S4 domain-containing protein [Bacteroidales bacterium]|jgi:ribosome-associated heat shock protein Hsp15|nr:RNA-binding S4 domain-containing protein [Bacteroidales bacterium]MDI9592660.1 S4 domain-containing protein [Bacteroidota bacterium]OQC37020.1 MAG: Heat shock protein 15 [Bacteroidetes bacterium ADurb.Bin041]MBP7873828.1 RNA-binding S4 domain-containing protein [Bacteroidales bacterium]MCO6467819.1 RNA-binding S4 domain-containing protein [Bacteroidales bacterium]
MEKPLRIDKWLWTVRVFKTRSIATDACRSGKVEINNQQVKPSREIKLNDVIKVTINTHFTRTLIITGFPISRVAAKLVAQYATEITPAEEFEKLKKFNELNWEKRERGLGRPTKKERRLIDKLKNDIP